MATVSFEKDLMPFFNQYRGPMLWRLDITDYNAVRTNAAMIYDRISASPSSGSTMPPAPFDPLPQQVIDNFATWIKEGFPP